MKTTQEVKHCTIEDIGIKITGENARSVIDPVNKYLYEFAATGKCPKCGSEIGGVMGSFVWGLVHGEGFCTGGLYADKCGWPCRGLHYIKDDAGEMIFTRALPYVLAYHPEFVKQESST